MRRQCKKRWFLAFFFPKAYVWERAQAYIEEGPNRGNAMMGEFDTVAQEINESVDAFMEDRKIARFLETLVEDIFILES